MNTFCTQCGSRLQGPVCGRCGVPSEPDERAAAGSRRRRRATLALVTASLVVAGAAAGVGFVALHQAGSARPAAAAPDRGIAVRANEVPAAPVAGGPRAAPETSTVTVPVPAPPPVAAVGSDAQARADRCVSSLTVILQDVVNGDSSLAQGESQIPHQAARDLLDVAVAGVQSMVTEGVDQAGAVQDASYAEFHHYCQNKYGLPD